MPEVVAAEVKYSNRALFAAHLCFMRIVNIQNPVGRILSLEISFVFFFLDSIPILRMFRLLFTVIIIVNDLRTEWNMLVYSDLHFPFWFETKKSFSASLCIQTIIKWKDRSRNRRHPLSVYINWRHNFHETIFSLFLNENLLFLLRCAQPSCFYRFKFHKSSFFICARANTKIVMLFVSFIVCQTRNTEAREALGI